MRSSRSRRDLSRAERHESEVFCIHTPLVSALVVQLQAGGDGPNIPLIEEAVCQPQSAAVADIGVAGSVRPNGPFDAAVVQNDKAGFDFFSSSLTHVSMFAIDRSNS